MISFLFKSVTHEIELEWRSVISLVAGLGVGALYGYSGHGIQNGDDAGYKVAFGECFVC